MIMCIVAIINSQTFVFSIEFNSIAVKVKSIDIMIPQYFVVYRPSCSPSKSSEELIFIELYGA